MRADPMYHITYQMAGQAVNICIKGFFSFSYFESITHLILFFISFLFLTDRRDIRRTLPVYIRSFGLNGRSSTLAGSS